jgi:hypothetical protein
MKLFHFFLFYLFANMSFAAEVKVAAAEVAEVRAAAAAEVIGAKTQEQFAEFIKNNEFLIKHNMNTDESRRFSDSPGKNGLNGAEIGQIDESIRLRDSNYGGIFGAGRNIADFSGDILVVGGGKGVGITGLADPAVYQQFIVDVTSGIGKFSVLTGEKITEINKKEIILQYESKITEDSIENIKKLNTYFTINIDPMVQPDLLASITSESDMSHIPDHRFGKIIFENVNGSVFLNPNIYKILRRILKPGGELDIIVPFACRRLIIPMTEHTEWGEAIKKQMLEAYQHGVAAITTDGPPAHFTIK